MSKKHPNLNSYKSRGEKLPTAGKGVQLYLSCDVIQWLNSLPRGEKSSTVDRFIREGITRSKTETVDQ